MSRILRSLVCLLLICCILVNLSPLNAQATGAGVVVGGLAKAASVSVPALWPIVAALAVVGVTAYGIESGAFENIANSCYNALSSAGTWINNGMAEILRTEDAEGNVQFYVDGGMLEDVRSWLFDSGTVVLDSQFSTPENIASQPSFSEGLTMLADHSYITLFSFASGDWRLIGLNSPYNPIIDSDGFYVLGGVYGLPTYSSQNGFSTYGGNVAYFKASTTTISYIGSGYIPSYSSSYDLTLGYLPSEDTELTEETIVTFHPYLANVIRTRTGGSGGSGDDENKWWLAVAYAETLEKLYQTSQQAQIENPSVVEIPDLQEGTQYEVTVEEDEDGNKKYILNPIYDPGTNPGTGTDPDLDPDPDPDPGNGDPPSDGSDSTPDNPGSSGSTWKPSSDPTQFKLVDLSKFFPFCIPFDLFDFFKLLNADPVAPSFTWEIQDLSGQTYGLTVDLSQWDSVAQLFRRLQLFLFVCGLAAASRKYIKW